MKTWCVALLKILLSGELAFAGSNAPMSTHVEQVSAVVGGQTYLAQLTQVQMPGADSKTVTVNEIAISSPTAPPVVTSSVRIETPARLNGKTYVAGVNEPLAAQDRTQAIGIAQNQVDYVRRSAPSPISQSVQSSPVYGASVPSNVIVMTYDPSQTPVQTQLGRLKESALENSNAAFSGLQRAEQASNQDAARFAQAIQQGTAQTLSLQRAADQSTFTFTQSMSGFSAAMQSLHDRDVQTLALEIAQSDPVLKNILSDGEAGTAKDIRRATVDVSPLNPRASENIKRYGDRFFPNGLLRNGLFSNTESFPATPAGHRLLESANILSEAVTHDPSLGNQTASRQLIGTGWDYLHAAMEAQRAGRTTDAERLTEKGRRIARALSGENLPDDLDRALSSPQAAIALHEQALRETLGISGAGRDLLNQAFSVIRPSSAEGRTAAALGRALAQNPQGLSDAELSGLGLTLADAALGMVPVVNSLKSLLYMAAGRNLLTGQPLTALDYTLCAIDVLSLGASGPLAKVAGILPEALGSAFGGSRALLTGAMAGGAQYVRGFGTFVTGAVGGIRDLEAVAPGFALKNFVANPGAVLALGQNVSRYGGADLAKELVEYSVKNSLDIVETAHISRFAGGFTKFVTVADYEKYATQTSMLAGKGGGRMFLTATTEYELAAKGIEDDAGLAKWLGKLDFDESSGGFMRIDMDFDLGMNPRIPTGQEAGANAYFRTGGRTSGGAIEVAVDPISMGKVNVRGKAGF